MSSERLARDLRGLALDLRWAWSPAFTKLWEYIDAQEWRTICSPWIMVSQLGKSRLAALAADAVFIALVDACRDEQRRALATPGWFSRVKKGAQLHTVAYFSMEFGLSEALPIYSGGLGVLAGDHLKAASDLGVPIVGVGLLYGEGYFRQILAADGLQQELYPRNEPNQLPIARLRNAEGEPICVRLAFPGRMVRVRVWEVAVGRVRLLLLDTNDAANTPADRAITARLYGDGKELRLAQELVLGVGGCRVLQELGISPEVRHLNEGHAAFAIFEHARRLRDEHELDFQEALIATRAGNIFTTHTAVEAAFDQFEKALATRYLGVYANEIGVDLEMLLAYGRPHGGHGDAFIMPYLAVRGCGYINGVSRLHGEVSRELFWAEFPRHSVADVPIGSITNGVHLPTWSSPAAHALGTDPSDTELWAMRTANRTALIEGARARLLRRLRLADASSERIASAERALDPQILTLGFARRFTAYKRVTLLLSQPERLIRLLRDPRRPMQIVIAGKAHPADSFGKTLVRDWVQFAERAEARERVVFVDDYDLFVAEELVRGADVWLNTPRRPWEASGTSGMKVLANGGLNLSELDGWWVEGYHPSVGWALGDGENHDDEPDWDQREAEQLYHLLEDEVLPKFYDYDEAGLPRAWLAMMRTGMTYLAPAFSAERMVREYTTDYYLPAAERFVRRIEHQGLTAKRLHGLFGELHEQWSDLQFVMHTVEGRTVEVELEHGRIDPDLIHVELFTDFPVERLPFIREAGGSYRCTVPGGRPLNAYTARVVPRIAEAILPLELPLMTWQR
jgi:starch phosphorylase